MVVDEIKDMYRQYQTGDESAVYDKEYEKKIHLQGQLDLNRSAKMKSSRSSCHKHHHHHHG